MTDPGWYPDPAGAPDTYRYWDGEAWSQMTTASPPSAGGSAPGQPSVPSAPTVARPAAGPGPGAPSGRSSARTAVIATAGVVALAVVAVGGFFGIRAISDDAPEAKGATSPPTSGAVSGSPSDALSPTSTVRPSGIQCTGGQPEGTPPLARTATRITGGGLTMGLVPGYEPEPLAVKAHTFADGVQAQLREVVPGEWYSEYGLGSLARSSGYTDPAQAAEVIMQCILGNDSFYETPTSRKDLTNEDITVAGRPAHRLTSEIRINDPRVAVEGDQMTVVVVDTGSADTYGLFLANVTIGETDRIAQVDQQIAALKLG